MLNLSLSDVSFARGLEGVVTKDISGGLLSLSLGLVCSGFGLDLGIGDPLGSVGLDLLGGAAGSQVRVVDGLADGLLGTADVGTGGVGDLGGDVLYDVGHGGYVLLLCCWFVGLLVCCYSKRFACVRGEKG